MNSDIKRVLDKCREISKLKSCIRESISMYYRFGPSVKKVMPITKILKVLFIIIFGNKNKFIF